MLPNFFVVGAQKAATTSLHNYLVEHPQIYLPEQKETKFFVDASRYRKGIKYYEKKYFDKWNGEPAIGEVDPDYMYFEEALERIKENFDLSKLRFIFILRNPVDRAFSHYLMTFRRGLETLSFEDAIEKEEQRIKESYAAKMHFSYISRGFYHRQIQRFLRYVKKDQMHFVLTDDFEADSYNTIIRIFDFLRVDRDFVPSSIHRKFHVARVPRSAKLMQRIQDDVPEKRIVRIIIPSKRWRHKIREKLIHFNQRKSDRIEMYKAARNRVTDIFRHENELLEKLIKRDLTPWSLGKEIKRRENSGSGTIAETSS